MPANPWIIAALLLCASGAGAVARPLDRSPIEGVMARPDLAEVKRRVHDGRYGEALGPVQRIVRTRPTDLALVAFARRLDLVAEHYRELDPKSGRSESLVHRSVLEFLDGHDRASLLLASYALSLPVAAPNLDPFIAALEQASRLQAERLRPASGGDLLAQKLQETQTLFEGGRFEETAAACEDMLILVPRYSTALSRRGSAQYLLGRYEEAQDSWRQALSTETRAEERAALVYMLRQVRQKIGG